MRDPFTLVDWRRLVAEMYFDLRQTSLSDRQFAWRKWRAAREALFRDHPQSPLDEGQRSHFQGLPFYPYDPGLCIEASRQKPKTRDSLDLDLGSDGNIRLILAGNLSFVMADRNLTLSIYWIEGYGGGLFLPFRDLTNGAETFGGGRYLIDTIKGADLGIASDSIILDFNFAYNPSCAYHPRWACPLPPPENKLQIWVRAGEKAFTPPISGD